MPCDVKAVLLCNYEALVPGPVQVPILVAFKVEHGPLPGKGEAGEGGQGSEGAGGLHRAQARSSLGGGAAPAAPAQLGPRTLACIFKVGPCGWDAWVGWGGAWAL